MEKNKTTSGIGILDVIQIVFIILKLVGVITWPWHIVLIPLWISLGLLVIIFAIYGIVAYRNR